MTRLAHISDLHFGREIPHRIPVLINHLKTFQPDLTVVSGDLTQRATKHQYHLAGLFLKQIPGACLVIPGNHDLSIHRLYERFFHPWKKWQHFIDSTIEPKMSTKGIMAIGLKSAHVMGHRLNWTLGRINAEQLDKFSTKTAAAPDDWLRVVVAHHPFRLPKSLLHRKLIGGHKAALRVFKNAGIDLILGGHIHVPYTLTEKGMIICHAGSAISNRQVYNHDNSFNLISGNRIQLTIETLVWDSGTYHPVSCRKYRRFEAGWRNVEIQRITAVEMGIGYTNKFKIS